MAPAWSEGYSHAAETSVAQKKHHDPMRSLQERSTFCHCLQMQHHCLAIMSLQGCIHEKIILSFLHHSLSNGKQPIPSHFKPEATSAIAHWYLECQISRIWSTQKHYCCDRVDHHSSIIIIIIIITLFLRGLVLDDHFFCPCLSEVPSKILQECCGSPVPALWGFMK